MAAIHEGVQRGEGVIVRWDGQGRLHGGGGESAILRRVREKNRSRAKAEAEQHLEIAGLWGKGRNQASWSAEYDLSRERCGWEGGVGQDWEAQEMTV